MKNSGFTSNDAYERSRGSSKYDANGDSLKSVSASSYSGNNHNDIRRKFSNSSVVF